MSFFSYLPIDFVLNIMISQAFFAAIRNVIEILEELIRQGLALFVLKLKGRVGDNFLYIFKDYLNPIITSILFIIIGTVLSLISYYYNQSVQEEKLTKIRAQIKEDVEPEKVIDLISAYNQYYTVVRK